MHVDFPEHIVSHEQNDASAVKPSLALLNDVKVNLEVSLGSAEISVKELMALQTGSVVQLQKHVSDTVNIQLNDKTIARAEIVAVGEQFGIRITEILMNAE